MVSEFIILDIYSDIITEPYIIRILIMSDSNRLKNRSC